MGPVEDGVRPVQVVVNIADVRRKLRHFGISIRPRDLIGTLETFDPFLFDEVGMETTRDLGALGAYLQASYPHVS